MYLQKTIVANAGVPGAENGSKSHPASTGTKFRERAKRGLNRSKNAFSGRKICKTNEVEIRVTLILRHVNDSFPTARKMRKIRLFTSLTGGDGGCARDAGKGRGRNASDAVVFMILKAAQAFLRGRAEVLR